MVYSYDETPYDSHAFPESHPDRLATIARLLGAHPADVTQCRVLELGCASGGNLLPMAVSLPNSHFVGVDLGDRQIAQGRATIEALGMRNIELRHLNLMDMDQSFGSFDYIVAHGLYSYVPLEVREKIMQLCRSLLTPDGVAYISYNTYPGWHFRRILREMMYYHMGSEARPDVKAQKANELLQFVASGAPEGPYRVLAQAELEFINRHRTSYLLHDHLEEVNEPVYFHQFAKQAADSGLQYLGEAEFWTMMTTDLPPHVRQHLRQYSSDLVQAEQYLDFARNRAFRRTLLCRKEVPLNRKLTVDKLASLLVTAQATADADSSFSFPGGTVLATHHPSIRAAFQILSERFPQYVPFEELVRDAATTPGTDDGPEVVRHLLGVDLLTNFTRDLVQLRVSPARFVTEVSELPQASALSRNQAQTREYVTNALHQPIFLNPLARRILELLDGTRTRDALRDELKKMADAGSLEVQRDGTVLAEPWFSETTDECLSGFARVALLTA